MVRYHPNHGHSNVSLCLSRLLLRAWRNNQFIMIEPKDIPHWGTITFSPEQGGPIYEYLFELRAPNSTDQQRYLDATEDMLEETGWKFVWFEVNEEGVQGLVERLVPESDAQCESLVNGVLEVLDGLEPTAQLNVLFRTIPQVQRLIFAVEDEEINQELSMLAETEKRLKLMDDGLWASL